MASKLFKTIYKELDEIPFLQSLRYPLLSSAEEKMVFEWIACIHVIFSSNMPERDMLELKFPPPLKPLPFPDGTWWTSVYFGTKSARKRMEQTLKQLKNIT